MDDDLARKREERQGPTAPVSDPNDPEAREPAPTSDADDEAAAIAAATLSRGGAVSVYKRLEDAGLDCRLQRVDGRYGFAEPKEPRHVVDVDVDSIKTIEALRLIADLVDEKETRVSGYASYLRIG